MKKIITFLVFTSTILGYSQNRYGNISTSTYQPMSSDYYMRKAELKGEQINDLVNNLSERVSEDLSRDIDLLYRNNLLEVNSYLNLLNSDAEMSVSDAEWYSNKARKLYNKALRKYNKRLKNR
jgi:glycyl-tRNA synthetase alpha subunit